MLAGMHKKKPSVIGIAAAGGRARAEQLSADERRAIARHAAVSRWTNQRLPQATHDGTLLIGEMELACAVLEDGTRLLSQRALTKAIGAPQGGHAFARRSAGGVAELPIFLANERLKPFISVDLAASLTKPVEYLPKHGGRSAFGIKAELVPAICDVWLKAREALALTPHQHNIAHKAELLVRGLAHVGIIALVDEATGYQADRARDELAQILEAYIAKELLPWTQRFPTEFFRQIYRLQGWEFRPGSLRGPRYVGKLINKLVYGPLPPGVLEQLKHLNPPNEKGYRRYKHHQFLTDDIGNPHLERQIVEVTTLMRVSDDKQSFEQLFRRAFPRAGEQLKLTYPNDDQE
jgi:hypothetical protein